MRRQFVVLEVQTDNEAGEQPVTRSGLQRDLVEALQDPGVRVLAVSPPEVDPVSPGERLNEAMAALPRAVRS